MQGPPDPSLRGPAPPLRGSPLSGSGGAGGDSVGGWPGAGARRAHSSAGGEARLRPPRPASRPLFGAESPQQAPHAHPAPLRRPAPVPTSLFLPPLPQGPKGAVKGPRRGGARRGQDSGCRPGACAGTVLCAPPRAAASRAPVGLHGNSGPRRRFRGRLPRAFHIWAPTRALVKSLGITTLIIRALTVSDSSFQS